MRHWKLTGIAVLVQGAMATYSATPTTLSLTFSTSTVVPVATTYVFTLQH